MSGGWFITGTDTGVGKTLVSRLLLEALKRAGHSAVGMKPVASGCHDTAAGLRSDDALELMQVSGAAADYADVNPYALGPACAPHIAAREAGVEIQLEKILESFRRLRQKSPWVVVEGVGGWRVPLGGRLTMAEVAHALGLPVILVVGLRLGCLNHALLTAEAIRRADLPLAGWVANRIDPAMTHVPENIATLAQKIGAPLLAQIAYQSAAKPDVAVAAFPIGEMLMRFN
jgi:dethiobiotin synthetase